MNDPLTRKYAFCAANKPSANLRNAIIGFNFNKMVKYLCIVMYMYIYIEKWFI